MCQMTNCMCILLFVFHCMYCLLYCCFGVINNNNNNNSTLSSVTIHSSFTKSVVMSIAVSQVGVCNIRPGLDRHFAIDVAGQRSRGVAECAGALL